MTLIPWLAGSFGVHIVVGGRRGQLASAESVQSPVCVCPLNRESRLSNQSPWQLTRKQAVTGPADVY